MSSCNTPCRQEKAVHREQLQCALQEEFLAAVATIKEHIMDGDIFQLVLSQRFERRTFATPFEVYRALRIVNPSPYMVYMQVRGNS